jgi:hypothetical protein
MAATVEGHTARGRRRRFRLTDGMVLVAATAAGLAAVKPYLGLFGSEDPLEAIWGEVIDEARRSWAGVAGALVLLIVAQKRSDFPVARMAGCLPMDSLERVGVNGADFGHSS